MPSRTSPPVSKLIPRRKDLLIETDEVMMDNHMPLHVIREPASGLFRLDIIFKAGMWYESAPLVAAFTHRMLREGSQRHDSAAIAEILDFHGAYLDDKVDRDRTQLSLYGPRRFASVIIPLLTEILSTPSFPDPILQTEIQHQKQEFLVNLERVGFVARNQFMANLFGSNHPYGRRICVEDYDRIEREQLLIHYKHHYHPRNTYAILAGDVDAGLISILNDTLGQWNTHPPPANTTQSPALIPGTEHYQHTRSEDTLQSAIRVGKRLFNRKHADFIPTQFLISLLGGYFGSRLMKNIREEKGYTYGIGAILQPMERDGVLSISAEVGKDYVDPTLVEIIAELDRLSDEAVREEEISLVRNYMTGSLMRSLDGPFAKADRLRGVIDNELGNDYFISWHDRLTTITPDEIARVANMYLNKSNMYIVVSG